MNGRHGRTKYYVVGEGTRNVAAARLPFGPAVAQPTAMEESTEFRFSRFISGLKSSKSVSLSLLEKLAVAMSQSGGNDDPNVPSGYTYLGQFLDHDLTLDPSELDVTKQLALAELISMRSPTLDLDSLYGKGPTSQPQFYESDGVHLKRGRPARAGSAGAAQDGMDLPRHRGGAGPHRGSEREANIPDIRNDENLAVAQIHAAFIRFHNRVADRLIAENTPSTVLFEKARELVTKHYQWMVVRDYLPRIADPVIVSEVFLNGRQFFETKGEVDATMPLEFSGAAFRLGHSQVRTAYQWNAFFNSKEEATKGPLFSGHLHRLFRFSGTSGSMTPSAITPGSPEDLADLANPSNPGVELPDVWVADFTRLFHFDRQGIPKTTEADFNLAKAIDAHLVEPLASLPPGSFGGVGLPNPRLRGSLAFRNLARGNMLELVSGPELAKALGASVLTREHLLMGNGGPSLVASGLAEAEIEELVENTPLWFYILREAEFNGNKLGHVGSTLVVETFHRAIEQSSASILADKNWKPRFADDAGKFDMSDLLFFAFEGKQDLLNPH